MKMTVEAFLEKYHLSSNKYCVYCMSDNCIYHNIETHTCKILDFVDNYGVNCNFYKTVEQEAAEKRKLRKRIKNILGEKNADYVIAKLLKYNPELKEDYFFYDLLKDFI